MKNLELNDNEQTLLKALFDRLSTDESVSLSDVAVGLAESTQNQDDETDWDKVGEDLAAKIALL